MSERTFMSRVLSIQSQIIQYHNDALLQALARSLLPMEEMEADASKNSNGAEKNSGEFQDKLLKSLLIWFRTFFSWTNNPPCSHCGNADTSAVGGGEPTAEELANAAGRVELYSCERCPNKLTRFPRYNNPGKLLETRTGRCGEWANCFHLFVKALNFDVRAANDWTDHVWCEVYSHVLKRWVHTDMCENGYDQPLMYENGWGKKLTYVIAVSAEEIQDVTWRYSQKHAEVLARRLDIREHTLIDFIERQNRTNQVSLPPGRREELFRRYLTDLAELLSPKLAINSGEDQGRTSGSLEWRAARGELGATGGTASLKTTSGFIIKPTKEEIDTGKFSMRYCCASDQYQHTNGEITKGWATCIFECENVGRNVERDWQMCYIARTDAAAPSASGELAWKFDFSDISKSNKKIAAITVCLKCDCFDNGKVQAQMCTEANCILLRNTDGKENAVRIDDLDGSLSFTLKLSLFGGKGDVAWQHAQLCRTALCDVDLYVLKVLVLFA